MNTLIAGTSATRWWQALNPAIYLVSILPGVAVWLLALPPYNHQGLWLATFAVVLLQHSINLFNDAKDWHTGADIYKFDSWVRVHHGSSKIAFYHGLFSLLAGGLLGLSVLLLQQQLWILLFAVPLVLLGVLYNAGQKPLSYTAAGEWATALCYGPGVFGGLWFVADQPFNATAIMGMAAFAAFATALLFSHQPPQIETDRQAGKRSFAVRHGSKVTYQMSTGLYIATLLLLSIAYWQIQTGVSVLSPIIFALSSAAAVTIIINLGPNPKRIMLSASVVFLITLCSTFFA